MEPIYIIQIILLFATCFACFRWGETSGINAVVTILLDRKVITLEDLEKLEDDVT